MYRLNIVRQFGFSLPNLKRKNTAQSDCASRISKRLSGHTGKVNVFKRPSGGRRPDRRRGVTAMKMIVNVVGTRMVTNQERTQERAHRAKANSLLIVRTI